MVGSPEQACVAAVGRWAGLIGLLVAVIPRPALGQRSAVVQTTARVVVSVAAENRVLVSGLAREWVRRRTGLLRTQGSLALVRFTVVEVAGAVPGMPVGPLKPTAIVDIQYLRN